MYNDQWLVIRSRFCAARRLGERRANLAPQDGHVLQAAAHCVSHAPHTLRPRTPTTRLCFPLTNLTMGMAATPVEERPPEQAPLAVCKFCLPGLAN